MEQLNEIIALNLKKIRDSRNMSLDKMSKVTGVSKSMLGQIERGESNPTITTLWKIAIGLKVSFTSLLNQEYSKPMVISEEAIEPLSANDGKYKLYPFFPYEEGRNFEMHRVVIEPGGHLKSDAHGDKVEEFITVFQGVLTIGIEEEEFQVKEGRSIKFRADKEHYYNNSGAEQVALCMVVHYPHKSE